MQIRIFSIPAHGNTSQTDEMNAFLRGHKIIDIEKQFVSNGDNSFWSFCIRYIEGSMPSTYNEKREKIDYKNILNEPTFLKFSQLRIIRKQLAEKDVVPAYAVFTDEELAGIANLPEITIKTMQTVKGIGVKKIEKYGTAIVNFLNQANETGKSSD